MSKMKYDVNDALNVLNGELKQEMGYHSIEELPNRTKAQIYELNEPGRRQFSILVGDYDKKNSRFDTQQTKILLQKCELTNTSDLFKREVDRKTNSHAVSSVSRINAETSKLAWGNHYCYLVENEKQLKSLLRWYVNGSVGEDIKHENISSSDVAPALTHLVQHIGSVEPKNLELGCLISKSDQSKVESAISTLSPSERDAVVKVRLGQGKFRDSLKGYSGSICWMTGIKDEPLLIASHILPWSHAQDGEISRRDPENGLLLSSLWDAAFDKGLITFDEEWQVQASKELSQSAKISLDLEKNKELPMKYRTPKRAHYLKYHRENVFKDSLSSEQE